STARSRGLPDGRRGASGRDVWAYAPRVRRRPTPRRWNPGMSSCSAFLHDGTVEQLLERGFVEKLELLHCLHVAHGTERTLPYCGFRGARRRGYEERQQAAPRFVADDHVPAMAGTIDERSHDVNPGRL